MEMRARPAEEITELNLDNCRATLIEGLTSDFKNLETLSLINVGLTTLKGFPSLPNLKKLELSDNRISGSLSLLQGCNKLTHLNLSGNKIKDIETLEPLGLIELKSLDLFNCEVTNLDSYREKVFELLKSLQFLDGYDCNNQEAEEDEDDENDDVEGEEEDDDEEEVEEVDSDEDEDDIVDVDDSDDADEDGDDDDDELDDEEDGVVGLEYLQKPGLEEDSEGEDFDPVDGEDEDGEEDGDDDEDDEDDKARGVKRKLDGQEESEEEEA